MTRRSIRILIVLAGLPILPTVATASTNDHAIRIAIVARDEGLTTADFLTVTLSKRQDTVVLERTAIAKVLAEQSLAAAGLSNPNGVRVGQMLKADVVVLLQPEPNLDKQQVLRCKVLSVHPGAVLDSMNVPLPVRAPSGLARILDESIARLRPKLLSPRHVVLSVPKFKSTLRKEDSLTLETTMHGLLVQRLSREPAFLTAERQDIGVLLPEQPDAPEAMPASILVEGTIEEGLEPGTPLQVHVYVRPKTGAVRELRITGTKEDVPALAEDIARRLVQELGETSVTSWEPEKEAAYFAERARWMMEAGSFEDALAASDVVFFLGKGTVDLERLHVDAGIEQLPPVVPYLLSVEPGTDESARFDHKRVCDRLEHSLDLMLHLEQVWRKDPTEPRTAVPSKYGYALWRMWTTDVAEPARNESKDRRMTAVLVTTRTLVDSCFFAWQDDIRKDPDAQERWDQTFQQYRRLLQLGLPADPRQALFAKVREAHVWRESPQEIIALIEEAWADTLAQPENSTRRLDGMKAIIDFTYNTVARKTLTNKDCCDAPRRLILRQQLHTVFKRHIAAAPTAVTRRYWEILTASLESPEDADQPQARQLPALPAAALSAQPTPDELAACLQEFKFLVDIGCGDEELAHYREYLVKHQEAVAKIPGARSMVSRYVTSRGPRNAAGNTPADQHKNESPPSVDPALPLQNGRLIVSGVWSPRNMPWATGAETITTSYLVSSATDAFWAVCTCSYYSQKEKGALAAEKKTFLLTIPVPDLRAESFECSQVTGPVTSQLTCNNRLFLFDKAGMVRADLRTREITRDNAFQASEPPLVVCGKILHTVVLVPDASRTHQVNGIVQIDPASLAKILLVSGLRTPPQTPLDHPAHTYALLHAHTNGDVFIRDMYTFKVTRDWQSTDSSTSGFVYNVISNAWRAIGKDEHGWDGWNLPPQAGEMRDRCELRAKAAPDKILPDMVPDATGWYCGVEQSGTPTIIIESRGGQRVTIPLEGSRVTCGFVSPQGIFLARNDIAFIPMAHIREYIRRFILKPGSAPDTGHRD